MDSGVNSQRRQLILLIAWCLLLMLAWALWLWHLDASDLTFDEAATYFIAHRPLWGILEYLRSAVREHPPVYYVLIHTWMVLAGTSEFSLRFFSIGVGLIALTLTGWLARLAMGRSGASAGIVPAVLLALTPGMAYYARDARMYSLGIVWTALSAGLFLKDWLLAQDPPRHAALGGLIGVHILAIFTHYYLLLPILAQPVILLVAGRWRTLRTWCAVHILPALAGLVWLGLAPGLQMTTGGVWQHLTLVVPTRFQVLHLLGKILFSPVVQVRFHLLYWVLALAGGGILLALWRRRSAGVWLILTLLIPLALAFQAPQRPVARYLIFVLPIATVALGFLTTTPLRLPPRWLAWGATGGLTLGIASLLVTGGLDQAITFDRSHYGHTLETIKAHARPGDGILFYGPWQEILFYYYDPGDLPPITSLPPYAPPRLKPAEAEPVLESLLARYDRLWVIPAAVDDVDPDHFVSNWLNQHAHAVWRTTDFRLYLPPLAPDTPSQPAQVAFGDVLLLEGISWTPQRVPAGEPLRLDLHWNYLRCPENDLRLALKLADASGHAWTKVQAGVEGCETHEHMPGAEYEGLMVPQGTPPGEYTVYLMVADTVTEEPLVVEGDKWLAAFTVEVTTPIHNPVLYGLPNSRMDAFCPPAGDDCATLVGYEPGGLRFQQGHAVPFELHWLIPDDVSPEVQFRVRAVHRPWLSGQPATSVATRTLTLPALVSNDGRAPSPDAAIDSYRVMLPFVTRNAPLPPSGSPLGSVPGRIVTLQDALALPPDALTGPAQVVVEVLGPDGAPWTTADQAAQLPLFDVTVDGRPVLRRLPVNLTPVQADFGDEVGLRGYRVEGSPEPGGQLDLTYAWHARTRPTAIYAVFNHLVSADGTLVAQADGWPQEGRMLTIQWQAGEYIEDIYTLTIPADAPPGPYTLYTGLYDAATNERQSAFLDGQRLPGDQVPIPLPGENER